MAEVKKYKRKSLKKTLNTVIKIKNSTPKIIFKAESLVVTLRNKAQLNRWLKIYPNACYTIT
jgi:hypothetical protein